MTDRGTYCVGLATAATPARIALGWRPVYWQLDLAGWQDARRRKGRLTPTDRLASRSGLLYAPFRGGAAWMSSMNWSPLNCPAGAR